jgi:hypothetical protein
MHKSILKAKKSTNKNLKVENIVLLLQGILLRKIRTCGKSALKCNLEKESLNNFIN